ncbi:integral membrane sensor signal transduction histidine kinase [Oscillochloris trichoides DG-6]|uniref:Integral membrane sensor signal transduction histidine kinase n=1 Tax=Oscillochloris trichoides DG-6 TaxID=765420 RepID=E1IBE2_9CHLR|nr:ATP-binding protein [Oscillochloris trichoides]EFO81499.1 integral membrane sensor signal transduction histidine kinase [Oscillochloris trichoides DG-6]
MGNGWNGDLHYLLLALLDWALISGSFFNTITLLWLGMTVLLSAERRTWGTWLAGGGLVFGGLFFIGHTIVVGRVFGNFDDNMDFYWRTGWLVLIVAPYLWYVVMVWYSGGWQLPAQRLWIAGVSLLGSVALLMALFFDPLPSYADLARPPVGPADLFSPTTLSRLLYPTFATLCMVLALLTLRRPFAASERFMGDLARQRARPWLLAASGVLFLIVMLIGVGAIWFLDRTRNEIFAGLTMQGITLLISFDCLINTLFMGAVVLIGQAVVAYEVFTGATLPRGELARQWRRKLLLGGGYALVMGWSLSAFGIPEQPIYQLLIATILMTIFMALVGWRSAQGPHAGGLARLRPFVTSQNLYTRLLGPSSSAEGEPSATFQVLCAELLNTRRAYLLPWGSLADLAGPALAYPHGAPPALGDLALPQAAENPFPLCIPIDPQHYNGAGWAVPLRNERGLIGWLLLGPKNDGGIYTQEEIEVARAASERLLDARAASEMTRRLAALQRRRLAESQVLDRRTRRVLHDEVLPQIHASLLEMGGHAHDPTLQSAMANLQTAHRMISDLLHDLPPAIGADLTRLGALGALRRALDTDLVGAFDQVVWDVTAEVEQAAHHLDPLAAEALYYAAREVIRNAARHGRGATPGRRLGLTVQAQCEPGVGGATFLSLRIADDGVGMQPGPPRDDGGHGLALHSTMLAIMGGTLSMLSLPGQSTVVQISLPLVG